jgi:hypothetical protein
MISLVRQGPSRRIDNWKLAGIASLRHYLYFRISLVTARRHKILELALRPYFSSAGCYYLQKVL